jgi:hypothetical protein
MDLFDSKGITLTSLLVGVMHRLNASQYLVTEKLRMTLEGCHGRLRVRDAQFLGFFIGQSQ